MTIALAIGGSQDGLLFSLARNQKSLQNVTEQLSSGLRINSPVDDPSGFSLAENLQTKVSSYDAAANSVQLGTNYLQVASGALQSATSILQRMRALAVEANSNLLSQTDLDALQTEYSQLLQEINQINNNTQFNGSQVFSLLAALPPIPVGDPGFETPVVGGNLAVDPTGSAWSFTGDSGILASGSPWYNGNPAPEGVQSAFLQGGGNSFSQTMNGFVGGATYAVSFDAFRPNGILGDEDVDVLLDGQDLGTYDVGVNTTATLITTPAVPVAAGANTLQFVGVDNGGFNTIIIDAVSIVPTQQPDKPSIQTGPDEGDATVLTPFSIDTNYLMLDGTSLNTGAVNNPLDGPTQALIAIDSALAAVTSQATQVGSYIDLFNYEFDSDNLSSINLQSSESNIRDLNVATAVTKKTQLQLLISFGTDLIAKSNNATANILDLFRKN